MLNGNKFELKRRISNFNQKKPLTALEISVHHNLLLTGTDGSSIYVWDYEFNRILATINLVLFAF